MPHSCWALAVVVEVVVIRTSQGWLTWWVGCHVAVVKWGIMGGWSTSHSADDVAVKDY